MLNTNYSTLDESFKQQYEAGQRLVKEYQEQCGIGNFFVLPRLGDTIYRLGKDPWKLLSYEEIFNFKCSE
jgi:hypothetical protein